MKYIFFDMDGVLAEYRIYCSERDMRQKGYFSTLKPEWNMVEALKKMTEKYKNNKNIGIFILTKVYSSFLPYSIPEKIEWKNKIMPFISEENFIMVDGEHMEKTEAIKKKLGVSIDKNCYLIDDYNPNLNDWLEKGGTPIKYTNGVNDKNQSFKGDRINYMFTAAEIVDAIENITKIKA